MLSRITTLPVGHTPNMPVRSLARMALGFAIVLGGFAVAAVHLVQLLSGGY
ncbi:hypothetical protein SAMN05444165_1848 [Paraburkholderia phenazinium]|jgi:hypothetical protein|uniref:Uncharacterized protein n=1 Tax=Paraburkholderia phenazinium TaxID=60549 RepID=A0A1N6I6E0_9BURK|nr:hypothetical protein SAMN05444165_1848 [Paraburkholderia phenazinium]